jgi:hypothetical protein
MTGKKSLFCTIVDQSVNGSEQTSIDTHPNRFKKPNVSTIMPMNGHLRNTKSTPPRKHNVPRIFCFRAKK